MPYIRLTGGTARLRKLRDAEKPSPKGTPKRIEKHRG
jgi:hypothetical protein